MSQESTENIELVRSALYPPGAPDLVAMFADRDAVAARLEPYLHPDFETIHHEMAPPDWQPAGKGVRALVDAYAEWLSAWQTLRIHPVEFHDLGDRVLVLVRMTGTTKTHGAEVEQESAVIAGVEHGVVRTVKFFTRAEHALREAGLRG
ncbi:MAG: nuclear transport factor 2 family protein [Solirubrobacterales bacterium]